MQVINTHEAKTNLSKLLEKVVAGQEILIGRAGKPVAKLVPFGQVGGRRKGGQLKGKIFMAPDFDQLPKNFLKHFSAPVGGLK